MKREYRGIKDDIWGCNIDMPANIGKLWIEFFNKAKEENQ